MTLWTLGRLGIKHFRSAVAEQLYLRAGIDITRPLIVSALVNERCNVKCRHCEYWRLKHYEVEMTIEQWQEALLSLKRFVGHYSVNFSGGEPFLKKGFVQLLEFCRDQGIRGGVTTNGSCIPRHLADQVAAARPFNVNFSVDGPSADVHDYLRGSPGLFDKLNQAIAHLREARGRLGLHFPIIIKPTVVSTNAHLLPQIVQWAQDAGATAVHFQPVDRWSPETYDELWVEGEQLSALERSIEELIRLKASGYPILNSERALRLQLTHFRGDRVPASAGPCRIGLRNYIIRTNGDVLLCYGYAAVGNVKTDTACTIWHSQDAKRYRRELTASGKFTLKTSLSEKTIGERVRMGLKLLSK